MMGGVLDREGLGLRFHGHGRDDSARASVVTV
jgi:hypothetical protein